MADLDVLAIVLAGIGVLTSVATFVWWRIDASHVRRRQDKADQDMEEVRAKDRAILRFGRNWGGLTMGSVKSDRSKQAVLVPVENAGRHDGSISYAEWVIERPGQGQVTDAVPAFLQPRTSWNTKGDLTIPAGTRRLFLLPLPKRALEALRGDGEMLTLYVMPVGETDLIRASTDEDGVRERPWTADENREAEQAAARNEEMARYYEEMMAR